jgi:hypothetical protein
LHQRCLRFGGLQLPRGGIPELVPGHGRNMPRRRHAVHYRKLHVLARSCANQQERLANR